MRNMEPVLLMFVFVAPSTVVLLQITLFTQKNVLKGRNSGNLSLKTFLLNIVLDSRNY